MEIQEIRLQPDAVFHSLKRNEYETTKKNGILKYTFAVSYIYRKYELMAYIITNKSLKFLVCIFPLEWFEKKK